MSGEELAGPMVATILVARDMGSGILGMGKRTRSVKMWNPSQETGV
jgi:hypothetical protein